MPRDALTVTQITQAGATGAAGLVGVNANDIKIVTPSSDQIIWVQVFNSHATLSRVVTFKTNATYQGLTVPNRDVTVPALGQKVVRLEPMSLYIQAGLDVEIDVANDTDLTFYAWRL